MYRATLSDGKDDNTRKDGAMRIGIIGGTGKEGRSMGRRWALKGHDVRIGSRDAERAKTTASELSTDTGKHLEGGSNEWAIGDAEVVLLSVPYSGHGDTLRALKPRLVGKVLIDITVPLKPPKIRVVHVPAGTSAAQEAQAIVGAETPVVATLHHVSSVHLADADHAIACDVLCCSDDASALQTVMTLVQDLGMRALDAGPLQNAVALESLTPVLLHLNAKYKGSGAGITFTGI